LSIAGDPPDLKKINYLQLIIEKLTQPEIDYSYKILPYAKITYNLWATRVFYIT